MDIQLGRDFNLALCDHFGLKRVIDVQINNGRDELLSASIKVTLTADDLAAIAERMKLGAAINAASREKSELGAGANNPIPMPSPGVIA